MKASQLLTFGAQVTFVGQIRNISTQTTNVTYKLDDGTASIEVKVWIDSNVSMDTSEDVSAAAKPKIEEGTYARVWGRIKAFGGKRHVGAHVIRKIEDLNEVQYHLLEATAVHCHFTRGPPEQFKKTDGAGGAQDQQEGGVGAAVEMQGGKALPMMTPNAKKVFNLLRSAPQNNEGLHSQNIAAQLGMPVPDVMKAGDELLSIGSIFTTVDDDTWAILEF